MAIYGSWARGEATVNSDLDVAVIADATADHDGLLEALDDWAVLAGRVTARRPSLLIAERPAAARGPVWTSVRRDGIALVDGERARDGS